MALLFMKNNEDSLTVYIFFCLFVLLTMKICLLTTVSTKVQEVVKKIKNKKKGGGDRTQNKAICCSCKSKKLK